MQRFVHRLYRLLMSIALVSVLECPALACAPAPPEGEHVEIAAEEALIVWDPATRTEHFIRRADFRTESRDFGFLVPTPSQPELAEVKNAVFDSMRRKIARPIVTRTRRTIQWSLILSSRAKSDAVAAAAGDSVRVLDTQRVAGYDAVVLEADDSDALVAWLTQRGYAFRKELRGWLDPYIARRFKITAFKIAGGDVAASDIGTSAVRMSFQTEQPFFPYREPADARDTQGQRQLAVHFIAGQRFQGKLGNRRWNAETKFAGPIPDLRDELAGFLPGVSLPAPLFLSSFTDRQNPRPGIDEVYFSSSPQQDLVTPPPIIVFHDEPILIPVELIAPLVLVVAGAVAVLLLRRRSTDADVSE